MSETRSGSQTDPVKNKESASSKSQQGGAASTSAVGVAPKKIGSAPPGNAKNDGRKRLRPGEILFSEGDPGGDLYFIEEGTVEIYQGALMEMVHLTEMKEGEIIGVMTCLTREPRMATARAKTFVSCKLVPHDAIVRVLSGLPNWLKIILKEFTLRLNQMNRLYGDAQKTIKKIEEEQINGIYLGALISSAFAHISEFMAIKYEDKKLVIVDDVVQRLELVLNLPKERLEKIFGVIVDSGLLKLEIEPERKKTVTNLENAKKLAYFAQFVRESKAGPTKKLLRVKLTHRETRILSGMVKYAAKLEVDLNAVVRLAVKDLESSMERVIGVKFERDALQKGLELKLLTVENSGGQDTVVTRPSQLGRTIACLEAMRRLATLELDHQTPSSEAA